ncbi:MAG: DUF1653 domain-containing protein [Chitinophagales bacterium]|nr:DUF1653 domain-containing protein [Chitinophagales bacterium]
MDLQIGIYEHYKGKRYEVMGTALHSESLEPLVIYRSLYETQYPYGQLWVRPLAMFMETVLMNGDQVPRFKFLHPTT